MPNRIAPEKGIEVSADERASLEASVEELGGLIDGLRDHQLIADIIIFYNAARYALDQDIFYDEEDVAKGADLIAQGIERARSLADDRSPWTEASGLVVRGYRSSLDDSIQPYGLVVPDTYGTDPDRVRRLDIWHHGRNAKLSELRFLVERLNEPGRFTPEDTFVLHTYGRYCNAMKFAGEVDTFEALGHAKAQYAIDDDRVLMRGFSMGGAATWHLSTHYPDRWVAATPGAGFAETAIYQNVAEKEVQPPWWEQKLWGMYDATKYAGNLNQCPTIAYSGEIDKQMQAADIMIEHAAAEGVEIPHIIGKGMGHAYDDASKDEIERRLMPLVDRGLVRAPASVHFTTYTLKYDRSNWLRVTGLIEHWERADVKADISDQTLELATTNASALSIEFGEHDCPFTPGTAPGVTIDGTFISGPVVRTDEAWSLHLQLAEGVWRVGRPSGLRKLHGLQGPIDDAFMGRFLMVRPTGKPMMGSQISTWIDDELGDALYQWKTQFRGDALVKSDQDVTDDDIHSHHLVVWGDPASNAVLTDIVDRLPFSWDTSDMRIGKAAFSADQHVPVLIYPNPLNPSRYVVINSGFTFAPNGSRSNSTQTPKLPDWAILDVIVPALDRPDAGVVDAGFFDERWLVKG